VVSANAAWGLLRKMRDLGLAVGGCMQMDVCQCSRWMSARAKCGLSVPQLVGVYQWVSTNVAHEWAEDQTLDHGKALKAAAKTELLVSAAAKRILRAMARLDS
jgi:hypothetical protein